MNTSQDSDLELLLKGYRPTLAEITYRMPDYRDILQVFIWQKLDLPPRFPKLTAFLDFWAHNLDGPLEEVRVACNGIILPTPLKYVQHEFKLN